MSNEKLENLTEEDLREWGLDVVNKLEKALQEIRQLKRLLISANIPFENVLLKGGDCENIDIQS